MSENENPSKRKSDVLSPDGAARNAVGQMAINDLMVFMSNLMDEKLVNLPTKKDFEEIKTNVHELSGKIDKLQSENQALKEEVKQLKEENEKENKQILFLQEHSKRNNIIFKNIDYKVPLNEAVTDCCKENLKIAKDICIVSTRKLYEKDGKAGIIAEFQSEAIVREVFQHAKNLAGTQIFLDRDLTTEKQKDKRVMLELKKLIQNVSQKHRIKVINEKMRIDQKRFFWNGQKELVSGKQSGKDALKNLYGDAIVSININYYDILSKLTSKN